MVDLQTTHHGDGGELDDDDRHEHEDDIVSPPTELRLDVARIELVRRLEGPNGLSATEVYTAMAKPFHTRISLLPGASQVPMYLGELVLLPGEVDEIRYVLRGAELVQANRVWPLQLVAARTELPECPEQDDDDSGSEDEEEHQDTSSPSEHELEDDTGLPPFPQVLIIKPDQSLPIIDQVATTVAATLDMRDFQQGCERWALRGTLSATEAPRPIRSAFAAEVLRVHYSPDATASAITALEQSLGATSSAMEPDGAHVVRFSGMDAWTLLDTREGLQASPLTELVSIDPLFHILTNDTVYDSAQKTLDRQLQMPDAWARVTGSRTTVVAVIDASFDIQHPDLVNNLWINPGELPGQNTHACGNGLFCDPCGNIEDQNFIDRFDFDQDMVFTLHDLNTVDSATLQSALASYASATGTALNLRPDLDAAEFGDPTIFQGRDLLLALSDNCDDDGNGIVDDLLGVHYLDPLPGQDAPTVSNDPRPYAQGVALAADPQGSIPPGAGHGTMVASILGAEGNNERNITGITQSVRLMLIAVDPNQDGKAIPSSNLFLAIEYAAQKGAPILNVSLGAENTVSNLDENAEIADWQRRFLTRLGGQRPLVVVAAGNSGKDLRERGDSYVSLPAEIGPPLVLPVGASDSSTYGKQLENLRLMSDFGLNVVDIAAPGDNWVAGLLYANHAPDVYTSCSENNIGCGTSIATPLVAGTAALLLGATPSCDVDSLRSALLAGASKQPGVLPTITDGNFLDPTGALDALACP